MDPNQARGMYRRHLRELVGLRRYSGTGGSRAVSHEIAGVRADTKGAGSSPLAGSISQGDRTAVVLYEDLVQKGWPLPVTVNDKIITADGRELAIIGAPDRDTRKIGDEIIALVIQVRGP